MFEPSAAQEWISVLHQVFALVSQHPVLSLVTGWVALVTYQKLYPDGRFSKVVDLLIPGGRRLRFIQSQVAVQSVAEGELREQVSALTGQIEVLNEAHERQVETLVNGHRKMVRTFLDHLPIPATLQNFDGDVIFMNNQLERFKGKQALPIPFEEFVPESHQERAMAKRALADKNGWYPPYIEINTANGETAHVLTWGFVDEYLGDRIMVNFHLPMNAKFARMVEHDKLDKASLMLVMTGVRRLEELIAQPIGEEKT